MCDVIYHAVKKVDLKGFDEQILTWQLLLEEQMNAEMDMFFKDYWSRILKAFDNNFPKTAKVINKPKIHFKKDFKKVGLVYLFEGYSISKSIQNYLDKAEDDVTAFISYLIAAAENTDELARIMDDYAKIGYVGGGQSGYKVLNQSINFAIVDKEAIKKFEEYALQISSQFSERIQSRIKKEMLEGFNNAEGYEKMRKRIINISKNPITVDVPPRKDGSGKIIQSGYTYQLDAKNWSTTLSRTEISRNFVMGRLEAYRQSDVVPRVEFVTAPDERVCPICRGMDSEVYRIEDADGVIPVHANCRCTFVPILDCEKVSKNFTAYIKIDLLKATDACYQSATKRAEYNITKYYLAAGLTASMYNDIFPYGFDSDDSVEWFNEFAGDDFLVTDLINSSGAFDDAVPKTSFSLSDSNLNMLSEYYAENMENVGTAESEFFVEDKNKKVRNKKFNYINHNRNTNKKHFGGILKIYDMMNVYENILKFDDVGWFNYGIDFMSQKDKEEFLRRLLTFIAAEINSKVVGIKTFRYLWDTLLIQSNNSKLLEWLKSIPEFEVSINLRKSSWARKILDDYLGDYSKKVELYSELNERKLKSFLKSEGYKFPKMVIQ